MRILVTVSLIFFHFSLYSQRPLQNMGEEQLWSSVNEFISYTTSARLNYSDSSAVYILWVFNYSEIDSTFSFSVIRRVNATELSKVEFLYFTKIIKGRHVILCGDKEEDVWHIGNMLRMKRNTKRELIRLARVMNPGTNKTLRIPEVDTVMIGEFHPRNTYNNIKESFEGVPRDFLKFFYL